MAALALGWKLIARTLRPVPADRWRIQPVLLVAVMASLLLAACDEDRPPPDPTGVANDTAVTIDISQVLRGSEALVVRLHPGEAVDWIFAYETSESGGRVLAGDLVLRDERGEELGRIPAPLPFRGRIRLSTYLPDAPRYSPNP